MHSLIAACVLTLVSVGPLHAECVGDVDGNGDVDAADLAALLSVWGPCPQCAEDFDGNGDVDAVDLAQLLAAWGPCPEPTMLTLIEDFAGRDPDAADAAYEALFLLGTDAIGPLLEITNNTDPFAGGAYRNELSSILATGSPPSVALIAIHLIDAMLWDSLTPHYAPVILSDKQGLSGGILSDAIQLYQAWWARNEGLPLDFLRTLPFPLDGSGLSWVGPLLVAKGPGSGNATGPRTPYNEGVDSPCVPIDGPDRGNDPDPYSMVYEPEEVDGPTPYNCLAWALNCQTDRWSETPLAATQTWKTILQDYGYDPNTIVDCDGPCPPGMGPKIKMIFVRKEGQLCTDGNWKHAMKQEADGDWTSKNGQGLLWTDITDCDAFLATRYLPGPRQRREIKCFCK